MDISKTIIIGLQILEAVITGLIATISAEIIIISAHTIEKPFLTEITALIVTLRAITVDHLVF